MIRHAVVEELARLGAIVYTCSRNGAELDECLQDWESKGFRVAGSAWDLAHPLPKSSGAGSIVFMSSVCGVISMNGESVYSATKGAMNRLTKNLAREWAKDNIRSNSIAPWFILTPLTEHQLSNEKYHEEVVVRMPLGRTGEPEEVSSLVAFLCLSAASYIRR
ncbi:hypothetical protein NL676_018596 [Syzygium grande]|nr:hypothetical protein NL676_018596 [Syzygium grande]